MNETINYIIDFLLYGDKQAASQIGYTRSRDEWSKYKLVILPHKERLTNLYMPDLSQRPVANKVDGTYVVDVDIVYNTFFLISRAEELLNHERDQHGRFLARHSVLGKHNTLLIPIVDEYARFLHKTLEIPTPDKRISHINLTHDVDVLTRYRSAKSLAGAILKGEGMAALRALHNLTADPAYTFPWLSTVDTRFREQHPDIPTSVIYFLKYGPCKGLDMPQYHTSYYDLPQLVSFLNAHGAVFGLHSSYLSGSEHQLIAHEYNKLCRLLQKWKVSLQPYNRNHYLRSIEPEHLQALADAGITDDYTIGFADCAGFRLATTRAVRWINPTTAQLTSLTLHPLTIMDCTLSDVQYMNLSEDEAFYYCQQLIEKTRIHNGELTLLFHNQLLQPKSYHRSLYYELLKSIN